MVCHHELHGRCRGNTENGESIGRQGNWGRPSGAGLEDGHIGHKSEERRHSGWRNMSMVWNFGVSTPTQAKVNMSRAVGLGGLDHKDLGRGSWTVEIFSH